MIPSELLEIILPPLFQLLVAEEGMPLKVNDTWQTAFILFNEYLLNTPSALTGAENTTVKKTD